MIWVVYHVKREEKPSGTCEELPLHCGTWSLAFTSQANNTVIPIQTSFVTEIYNWTSLTPIMMCTIIRSWVTEWIITIGLYWNLLQKQDWNSTSQPTHVVLPWLLRYGTKCNPLILAGLASHCSQRFRWTLWAVCSVRSCSSILCYLFTQILYFWHVATAMNWNSLNRLLPAAKFNQVTTATIAGGFSCILHVDQ